MKKPIVLNGVNRKNAKSPVNKNYLSIVNKPFNTVSNSPMNMSIKGSFIQNANTNNNLQANSDQNL